MTHHRLSLQNHDLNWALKKNSKPIVLEVLFIQTNQSLLSPFQWFTLKLVEHTSTKKYDHFRKRALKRTTWTVSARASSETGRTPPYPSSRSSATSNQRRVLEVEGNSKREIQNPLKHFKKYELHLGIEYERLLVWDLHNTACKAQFLAAASGHRFAAFLRKHACLLWEAEHRDCTL